MLTSRIASEAFRTETVESPGVTFTPFRQDDADTRCIAEAFHLQRIDTVRQLPLHQKVITVGSHLIMFGTVHPKREVQRPIRIGSQMNHPQIIGKKR